MAEIRKSAGPSRTRGVIVDLSAARARAVAPPPVEQADGAGFSQSALELSHARAAVEAAPEVRTERVKALKRSIENGSYNPDPREVARKILERGL
jgi:negative regulator of flagellin synthesis FlgM